MARISIATIDKPEFINVTPYNPLISECEIKVFYLGENRNRSYINKQVAMEMANSLPGCPIVGQFKKDKNDFGDHGERITYDSDGVHFECLTKPYGFVAPNAKVWFQKFEETDELGNTVIREYLMTTGFLWTGQFPECQDVVNNGKPHSMELDEDTLNGNWTKNYNSNIELFIINDAIFSKLCILGDDVEPCFEGSTVTAPKVSTSFTMDDEFTNTLYTMMRDLKFALQEGGQTMVKDFSETQDKFEKTTSAEIEVSTEGEVNVDFAKKEEEEKKENPTPEEDKKEEKEEEEKKNNFAKKEEDEEEKAPAKEDEEVEEEAPAKEDKEEDEKKKEKFSLLEAEHQTLLEEHEALKLQFTNLQAQFAELQAFKNNVEDKEKDALIQSFYMLSEEDKKEVMENKAKYSLDDIEAKLSVLCVRKRVSFDLEEPTKVEEVPVTTFNLDDSVSSAPAWISAVKNTQKSRNI